MIDKFKYTDKEIDEIVKSITILVDTREKKNEHIINFFDKAKINYKNKAMHYGDYSFFIPKNEELGIPKDLYFDKEIIIERKANLEELSGNLSKERDRFEKELALAPKNKVLLIENCDYGDLINGNYTTKYSQKAFWASLHSIQHKFDTPFIFMPDHKCTGYFIRGYFTYYLKNYLR